MSFVNTLFMITLAMAGVANFLPVIGVVSGDAISRAYGVSLASPDLVVLMRHRAVLFGIVGGFVLVSLYFRFLQPAAVIMALVSMVAFLVLNSITDGTGPGLRRLFLIDLAATLLLLVGAGLKYGLAGR